MSRPGSAVLLIAALGFLLFSDPAEGTQPVSLAPRVKGVVIARSEHALIVDQVLGDAPGQPRTTQILLSSRTRVGGRRSAAAAITLRDLIRADGMRLPDGSLDALHVEIVLTAEEISMARGAPAGISGVFWQWILQGRLAVPLR